jgi:hypothetical protein
MDAAPLDEQVRKVASPLFESDNVMARKACRAAAMTEQMLTSLRTQCAECGQLMWVAYHTQRTITTLQGNCRLTLCVRRCRNQECPRYHCPYRPEEEGRWALPHGEFGLDVIALVGTLRYISHRSVPEIHQALCDRGIRIAERTVTHLLQRYEELVALRTVQRAGTDPACHRRITTRCRSRGPLGLARLSLWGSAPRSEPIECL